MPRPFLIAQLTDLHIGATWGPADPMVGLQAAVRAIAALPTAVDALVITGDLTDNGLDREYQQVLELVSRLEIPVHALPGNHDHRERLRRHFPAPGTAGAVQYAVDLGPTRLVALDSTRPGHDGGQLDSERLNWLDGELGAAPHAPTLLAMHHPPFQTGMPAFDRIGLPEAERRKLEAVVARHPQVRTVAAGHIHRTSTGAIAGRPALTVPSTYVEARLRLESDQLQFVAEPPRFALHALVDGGLVTHIETVHPVS